MSDAIAGANAPQPGGIGPFGAMRPLRGAMRQAPEERPSVTQLSLTSFIEMNEVPARLQQRRTPACAAARHCVRSTVRLTTERCIRTRSPSA